MKKIFIGVRLLPCQVERINLLSKETGRSKSDLFREAVDWVTNSSASVSKTVQAVMEDVDDKIAPELYVSVITVLEGVIRELTKRVNTRNERR